MNWNTIDTVFFDMDGTLIDLHFEDTFWFQHLPQCYAEHHQISFEEAHHRILSHNRSITGTLNWYSTDYWDDYLKMDILAMTHPLRHLLQFRPNVIESLIALKSLPIRTEIITNAHPRNFALKNEKLNFHQYIDQVTSSHEFGHPKEQPEFWSALQTKSPFNPERTLFIDDNLAVLEAAKDYGIQHIFAVPQPSSKLAPRPMENFNELLDFRALIPETNESCSTQNTMS